MLWDSIYASGASAALEPALACMSVARITDSRKPQLLRQQSFCPPRQSRSACLHRTNHRAIAWGRGPAGGARARVCIAAHAGAGGASSGTSRLRGPCIGVIVVCAINGRLEVSARPTGAAAGADAARALRLHGGAARGAAGGGGPAVPQLLRAPSAPPGSVRFGLLHFSHPFWHAIRRCWVPLAPLERCAQNRSHC